MSKDIIYYTKSIIDDDGILHVYSGWYNRYAPYVGHSTCVSIDTKVENTELIEKGELIHA